MGVFPFQGKRHMVEPGIEPGTSWLVVKSSDHQAKRLVTLCKHSVLEISNPHSTLCLCGWIERYSECIVLKTIQYKWSVYSCNIFFYMVTLIWNALEPSGYKFLFAQWELQPKQQHFKINLSGYFLIPPRISINASWLFRSMKLHNKLSDYSVSSQIQLAYYISRRCLLLYIFFFKHVKICGRQGTVVLYILLQVWGKKR